MGPWTPALTCAAAMAAGLAIDTRTVPLDVLAAWCADPAGPGRAVLRHWQAMPASHGLMLASALLLPVGRHRRSARLACALGVTGAMAAAAWGVPWLASLTGWRPAVAVGVAMTLGMVIGASAVHGLLRRTGATPDPARRLGHSLRARPRQP